MQIQAFVSWKKENVIINNTILRLFLITVYAFYLYPYGGSKIICMFMWYNTCTINLSLLKSSKQVKLTIITNSFITDNNYRFKTNERGSNSNTFDRQYIRCTSLRALWMLFRISSLSPNAGNSITPGFRPLKNTSR